VWSVGCGVWGLGFGGWGLEFGVWDVGCGVWGSGSGLGVSLPISHARSLSLSEVWGLGFRV